MTAHLMPVAIIVAVSLITTAISLFVALTRPEFSTQASIAGLIDIVVVFISIGVLLQRLQRHLQGPLIAVSHWAEEIRDGNLSASVVVDKSAPECVIQLSENINMIGESYREMSWDMDSQVYKETQRLAEKTRSLQVLYDVAASVNMSRDMDDLLTCFLHTLIELVHAEAATVRILTGDGQMRLVASNGFDTEIAEERVIPDNQKGLCGAAILDGSTRQAYHDDDVPSKDPKNIYIPYVDDKNVTMLTVPLKYREETLGVYNLFIRKDKDVPEGTIELLTSIGQHLGMALEKAHLDDESTRLSIVEERGRLANELHDSLAQTLASMKFQTSMLDDSLREAGEAPKIEILHLKSSLDEAYTELRELIAHFRAPVDQRGLVPALQGIIERFKRQTDITIFFQPQCPDLSLPIEVEMQAMRIVSESLANIRKHAHARTVRVLFRCVNDREYSILIEDDGVGIGEPVLTGKPGEHIGLSIMEERAHRIGGTLSIDSEPGEGTQVQLRFEYPQRNQPELQLDNG